MSRLTWRGDEFLRFLSEAVDDALTVAAATAAEQASRNIGSESGGVMVEGATGTRNIVNRRRGDVFRYRDAARTRRGRLRFRPSRPGDFPGYRTGHLARSMTFQSPQEAGTPGVAAYGTNVRYGRYLEYGTTRMQPRPWAMRTVRMAAPLMRDRFVRSLRASFRGIARRFP